MMMILTVVAMVMMTMITTYTMNMMLTMKINKGLRKITASY